MQQSVHKSLEYLSRRGWEQVEPQLDWNHLARLGFGEILDSSGQCIAELLEATRDNPFGWFGSKAKQARRELREKLYPLTILPNVPLYVPQIEAQLPPLEESEVDRVFELLGLTIIDFARRELLGTPNYIGQKVEETVMVYPQPASYDWSKGDFKGEFVAQWSKAQLRISPHIHWHSGGASVAQCWQFYSHHLRELATLAIKNIGIEISGRAYQVGRLRPEYSLEQFPHYIQEISDKLRFHLLENGTVERYNILIQGPPGTGKTRWAQSFAAQVLSPSGYLVAVLDYESIESFQLPDYVDRLCVIINDADNLCLSRENAQSGTSEKVLAWLDGSRAGYIQPMYLPTRCSTVTILTANTTERWDSAGLRAGRIHAKFTFDQVLAH